MNKITKLLTVLLATGTLLSLGTKKTKAEEIAESTPLVPLKTNAFGGVYTGIHGSYNNSTLKTDTTAVLRTKTVETKKTKKVQNASGGVHIGYNLPVNSCFYVGTELSANYQNKLRDYYGVYLKPSVSFNNISISGIVGGEYYNNKMVNKHTKVVKVVGAEVNYLACKNFIIGTYYNYAMFGTKNIDLKKENAITAADVKSIDSKVSLNQHRFGVKLSYLF